MSSYAIGNTAVAHTDKHLLPADVRTEIEGASKKLALHRPDHERASPIRRGMLAVAETADSLVEKYGLAWALGRLMRVDKEAVERSGRLPVVGYADAAEAYWRERTKFSLAVRSTHMGCGAAWLDLGALNCAVGVGSNRTGSVAAGTAVLDNVVIAWKAPLYRNLKITAGMTVISKTVSKPDSCREKSKMGEWELARSMGTRTIAQTSGWDAAQMIVGPSIVSARCHSGQQAFYTSNIPPRFSPARLFIRADGDAEDTEEACWFPVLCVEFDALEGRRTSGYSALLDDANSTVKNHIHTGGLGMDPLPLPLGGALFGELFPLRLPKVQSGYVMDVNDMRGPCPFPAGGALWQSSKGTIGFGSILGGPAVDGGGHRRAVYIRFYAG